MVALGGACPVIKMLLAFAKLTWPDEDIKLVSALVEPLYFKRATPADILSSHLALAVSASKQHTTGDTPADDVTCQLHLMTSVCFCKRYSQAH